MHNNIFRIKYKIMNFLRIKSNFLSIDKDIEYSIIPSLLKPLTFSDADSSLAQRLDKKDLSINENFYFKHDDTGYSYLLLGTFTVDNISYFLKIKRINRFNKYYNIQKKIIQRLPFLEFLFLKEDVFCSIDSNSVILSNFYYLPFYKFINKKLKENSNFNPFLFSLNCTENDAFLLFKDTEQKKVINLLINWNSFCQQK